MKMLLEEVQVIGCDVLQIPERVAYEHSPPNQDGLRYRQFSPRTYVRPLT